jgi:protein SCO1/2
VKFAPSTCIRRIAACALALCLALCTDYAHAQAWKDNQAPTPVLNVLPQELKGVDIIEHLGSPLPRDATFRDSDGKPVKLGDYFDGKRPTLFVFAYHTCPMLCSLVLDATVRSLNEVSWTVGDQFDVVSVSIDPKDTPETATKKRAQVIGNYPRANGDTKGWHFLVGEEDQIRKVTDAVGFKYNYDAQQKQYAHPAAIYLLSPEGTLERYLYGIQFPPGDVRLGLLEASEGRSISTTDRVLLFCYHYDPQGKRYSLVAMNVMRLGGGVTLVLLGSLLAVMWLRERRKRRLDRAAPPAAQQAVQAAGAHPS